VVLADVYERQASGSSFLVRRFQIRVPAYASETFAGRSIASAGRRPRDAHRQVRARANPAARLKPEMFAKSISPPRGGAQASSCRRAPSSPTASIRASSYFGRQCISATDRRVGPEIDGQVTVASGIKPGEKVVTSGAIFLRREWSD
jgi:cobalt-zinc-cadmium efflux system membrane fusion protein